MWGARGVQSTASNHNKLHYTLRLCTLAGDSCDNLTTATLKVDLVDTGHKALV